MNREEFKIVPNFYSTNTLTYILHNGIVIDYVEVFMNYGYVEEEKGKWKSTKKKKPQVNISQECEKAIKTYIDKHSGS